MDYRDYRGKRASSSEAALRRRNYPWITTRGFHRNYFDYLVHATLTHYASVATIPPLLLGRYSGNSICSPTDNTCRFRQFLRKLRLLGPAASTNERCNGDSIIRRREMTTMLCQISKNLRLYGPVAWTNERYDGNSIIRQRETNETSMLRQIYKNSRLFDLVAWTNERYDGNSITPGRNDFDASFQNFQRLVTTLVLLDDNNGRYNNSPNMKR